jgi:hypothetical protein
MPFAVNYAPEHEITKDFRGQPTLFFVARSVSVKPEAASAMTEIVLTGNDSWAERDLDRYFAEGLAELSEDDLRGPVPIAVAGSVESSEGAAPDAEASAGDGDDRTGRLVVFGDADFVCNELIGEGLNRDLFVNSVNWLLGDVEAIAVRPNRSRASRFQPTAEEFQRIRLLALFVLPEALAVLGVFTWWSRRQTPGA